MKIDYRPTAKSYFSGAGLMDLGLQMAGINVIQSLEIDSVCVDTLRKNFNHKIIHSDIRNQTVLSQEKSDIIVGTYPCTKYSAIADIHGARTGDDLYLHFFRQMAIEQPEMYVLENVPGMRKFPVVMEAMSKLPGYYINVFCPVDALNWLPQKRERLILFGTKKNIFITPPSYQRRIKLSEIIESAPDTEITQSVINRLKGQYRDKPIITNPENSGSYAPTCVAHYHKDRSTRLVIDKSHPNKLRPYTVLEYARLMGVPDWFKFSGTENQQFKQIGNGVAVNMAEWIGKEILKYFN
ncbi:MAG TPA: DNA (cytosine-5-)-methyltransferase [Prolixibacteraceae bacterium]|nr:DNA (cytosine-5-)-methyltransferase [Prolixibacteraceae bacterium]